jgi:Tol biopolymer transport system component
MRWGIAKISALVAGALWATIGALDGGPASAICNVIPGTAQTFRGTLGNLNRPFASPGDRVEVRLSPLCDAASPGFPSTAEELVVSVAFTPPHGRRSLVVLAYDCERLGAALAACGDAAAVRCVSATAAALDVVELEDQRRLRFAFPDTRGFIPPADDPAGDLALTGPATIAVTTADDPLPCDLVATPCAAQASLIACVDELFAIDGSCGASPHATFSHFTALPVPNDYQALCTEPAVPSGPCTGLAEAIHFSVDAEGNILLPMDWRGVLVPSTVPVARLLRGSARIAAGASDAALRVPSNHYLGSYTPEGAKMPPLLDPQTDPRAGELLTLFGSADAPQSVLRIARRSPTGRACTDGIADGHPCEDADDCPQGSCAPAAPLFDLGDRLRAGVGPVVIERFGAGVCQDSGQPCGADQDCAASRCVAYRIEAKDPVPLDGLVESERMLSIVASEGIEGKPLNADSDTTDDVLVLVDRASGAVEPPGAPSRRAVARIRQPPFTFPALAVENDVVAFLEPEPLEGDCAIPANCDHNGDGDVFDTILRVFRVEPDGATDVMAGRNLAVDAAPLVDDRSLAVSGGLVFFRAPELAACRYELTLASVSSTGEAGNGWSQSPGLSGDGRFIAFLSGSTNLVSDDPDEFMDIFVRDRETGENLRVATAWGLLRPAISADGRFVAYSGCRLEGYECQYLRGPLEVFDRDTGTTTRVSSDAIEPTISGNGRFVGFTSSANDVVPGDTNDNVDVFVYDRQTGSATRISPDPGGFWPALSFDGRFVAFGNQQHFVHDRVTAENALVSVDSSGRPPDDGLLLHGPPVISGSGRFIAFHSGSSQLVAGDTNGNGDVFVHDRVSRQTTRVNLDSAGRQIRNAELLSYVSNESISFDGRLVAFASPAAKLVADDPDDGSRHIYVHDRLTGMTARVGSGAIHGGAYQPAISADGGDVAFSVGAFEGDIFVHGCNRAAAGSDLTGDGRSDAVVLQVLDAASQDLLSLCPAGQVGVTGRTAVFLRPEAAGNAPASAGCPDGQVLDRGVDLNGDGDAVDDVVHLWRGSGAVLNLRCPATALSASPDWVAALVPKSAPSSGPFGSAEGDGANTVKIYQLDGAAPQSCADWLDVGQAGDAISVSGPTIAFTTPESARRIDLNDDGDAVDRVLQLYVADLAQPMNAGTLINVGHAAEEFVLGTNLVAFRTRECAHGGSAVSETCASGGTDYNGDGDADDDVLQIYDLRTRELVNTGQAVIPCRLEACDPRVPYRVLSNTVTFLTLEADQDEDLNGDDDRQDLILQTFNVQVAPRSATAALAAGVGTAPRHERTRRRDGAVFAGALTTVGTLAAGICTDTGQPCAADEACPDGTCFLPPGGCIEDLGTPCAPQGGGGCGEREFCQPIADTPGRGTCRIVRGTCDTVADCRALSACTSADRCTCEDAGPTGRRLVAPLRAHGGAVFVSAEARENGAAAACTGERCTAGTSSGDLVIAAAADSDADEIPDPFDNCPSVPNPDQLDSRDQGIGDACRSSPRPPCVGDCDSDGTVTVGELVTGVNIALERVPIAACTALQTDSGTVRIDALLRAVGAALGGCPT